MQKQGQGHDKQSGFHSKQMGKVGNLEDDLIFSFESSPCLQVQMVFSGNRVKPGMNTLDHLPGLEKANYLWML